MFIKLPKTRQFAYRPRFYEPPVEDDEGAPRVKFRRYRQSKSTTKRPLLLMVLMIIVLVFLLFHWRGIKKSNSEDFKFETIKIEEIVK